jgi:hypothetical protein
MADAFPNTVTILKGAPAALEGFRRIMTFRQLSEYMKVPRETLYVLAANQPETGFPAFRAGREWRAELGEVIAWLIEKQARGEDLTFVTLRLKRERVRKSLRLLN